MMANTCHRTAYITTVETWSPVHFYNNFKQVNLVESPKHQIDSMLHAMWQQYESLDAILYNNATVSINCSLVDNDQQQDMTDMCFCSLLKTR